MAVAWRSRGGRVAARARRRRRRRVIVSRKRHRARSSDGAAIQLPRSRDNTANAIEGERATARRRTNATERLARRTNEEPDTKGRDRHARQTNATKRQTTKRRDRHARFAVQRIVVLADASQKTKPGCGILCTAKSCHNLYMCEATNRRRRCAERALAARRNNGSRERSPRPLDTQRGDGGTPPRAATRSANACIALNSIPVPSPFHCIMTRSYTPSKHDGNETETTDTEVIVMCNGLYRSVDGDDRHRGRPRRTRPTSPHVIQTIDPSHLA